MKIVYYTDQTYLHGGIERVLANKINYLVNQKDVQVYLITTEQKGKPHRYKIDDRLISYDLAINYNREISYFKKENFSKIISHYKRLTKVLKQINPDIVIVVNYDYAFYFMPFIHLKSKKIKEYHSSRYYESLNRQANKSFLRKILNRVNDYIEKKYDRLVLLTKDEKRHFKSSNTIVIPNGIIVKEKKKSELSSKIAISAGRIAPVKGFDKLIKAWYYVALQYPDWKLQIYGDGDRQLQMELQDLIKELKLSEQVCLCGKTESLANKMFQSSIYVLSSKTECFPMVLLEAQLMGLPIVSFDCPYGPRNIIHHNIDGLLVYDQDEVKLSQSIIRLIEDGKMRRDMGSHAQINIDKYYTRKVMKKWLDLFKKLTPLK